MQLPQHDSSVQMPQSPSESKHHQNDGGVLVDQLAKQKLQKAERLRTL
jgi:hypothetical protein